MFGFSIIEEFLIEGHNSIILFKRKLNQNNQFCKDKLVTVLYEVWFFELRRILFNANVNLLFFLF